MAKVSVAEFIQDLLTNQGCKGFKHSRNNLNSSCPFHTQKKNTSSFGISLSKEDEGYPYQCQAPQCGVVGNIFTLICHCLGCDYDKANRVFLKRVAFKPINLRALTALYDKITSVNEELKAVTLSKYPVLSKHTKPMLKYLRWRNKRKSHGVLDLDYIIQKYGLYYCSEGRDAGRIIMPIKDLQGQWIQYNDRSIIHDAKRKSLHSAAKGIDHCLHGLYEAYGKKYIIIVEGSFDMFQVQCVIKNNRALNKFGVVTTMGADLGETRASMLAELFDRVYILYDHDEAGVEGAGKAYDLLNDYMPVYNITERLPKHKDPGICDEEQIIHAIKTKKTSSLEECRRLMVKI